MPPNAPKPLETHKIILVQMGSNSLKPLSLTETPTPWLCSRRICYNAFGRLALAPSAPHMAKRLVNGDLIAVPLYHV